MTADMKNVFNAEPVQWAADYIQDILETLEDSAQNGEYGLALLALEREELRGIWHELNHSMAKTAYPAMCGYGREGARLFIIRQLLAALPPINPCPLHNKEQLFSHACKRLIHEFFFLSGFRLALDKKAPSPEVVHRALGILTKSGLSNQLYLGKHMLHIYALEYELPDPAYYIYPSHTILCGATDFDVQGQLHCILHELGHVVYAAKKAQTVITHTPLRQRAAEQFANRFAASHLTPSN